MIYFVIVFSGPLWYSTAREPANKQFLHYITCFEEWQKKNPSGEMTRDGPYPRHPVFALLKPSAKKLMYRMLHLDPKKRITIQDALDDKWIQSIEVCCVSDETSGCVDGKLDAGCKSASRQVARAGVHRLHHHLPPASLKLYGREYDN